MSYNAIRNDTRKDQITVVKTSPSWWAIHDTVAGVVVGRALRDDKRGYVLFLGEDVTRTGLGPSWQEPRYRDHVRTLDVIPGRVAYYGAQQRAAEVVRLGLDELVDDDDTGWPQEGS